MLTSTHKHRNLQTEWETDLNVNMEDLSLEVEDDFIVVEI